MNLWQDVRYGARVLRNSPGFTATAVLTLALGIGATTAVFSVCDAMLWKPVPLPHLESLAMVLQAVPGEPLDWNDNTPADVADIRSQSGSFAQFASYQEGLANIAGAGSEPQRVEQALVTANFFDVLGVQPARGRAFQPGEDRPGRDHEVILSHNLWKNRFGGDPGIVGQSIRVDDEEYTVTGIMPAKFDFPVATQLWTPLGLSAEAWNSRVNQNLESVARLKPGVGIEKASAELEGIARRLEQAWPDSNKHRRFKVTPVLFFMIGEETREYTLMLLGAVVFVLLIACLNVANLQFARATVRMREVALRTALGASRGRVLAQLITESLLLSMAGAAFGLLLARWGMHMIKAGMPAEVEKYVLGWSDIQLDARALLFTLLAAVAAGIFAGLAPAWQCSNPNLTDALKEGGRGGGALRAHHRLRSALVAAEMALAVVLLAGGSLMVRGFQTLVNRSTSMEPATFLSMRLAITETRYPKDHQVAEFYRRVLERVNALPGVRAAVAVASLPYSGHSKGRYFVMEGRPVDIADRPVAMYQPASPHFFEALHVPLIAGRVLSDRDGADTLKVAVVSQKLANHYFPGQSPIGKRIKLGLDDSKSPWLTIVGVCGDLVHDVYDRGPRATLYVSYQQFPSRSMDFGVRAAGDPMRLVPAVTAAIRAVDPEEPLTEVHTLETAMRQQATGLNYMAVLMGIFGILALALSSIGIYGVMAYMVSEQTREIGIRMALGSPRGEVLGRIFRRGMLTAFAGLAVGLPAAYGFARLLSALVYGVAPTDATTFLGIPLALALAAALAIYVPARRATKIDPIVALRYE
jgi:putative ABC transport system permease protein